MDDNTQGLVLAAPAPLFSCDALTQNLQTITFTAKPFNPLALMPFQMPAVTVPELTSPTEPILPLMAQDPLASEQFCLVFTNAFQLVLVLGEDENRNKLFSFSFDPETVQQAWKVLSARVMLVNPDEFVSIANLVQEYPAVVPDFRIMTQFSQLLLAEFTEDKGVNACTSDKEDVIVHVDGSPSHHIPIPSSTSYRSDVELLQAFAHEVRTPLATIRTTTRLLLKNKDLPANVIKRLQMIDHECTEQIDRMELLFRAAELETSNTTNSAGTQLTPMCLEQVLQQSIPRWQQAASRRNLTLDVVLPQKLPTVISNPSMLDRVLTNLIENFARNLPSGSQLQVQVITAGNQLKLQLLPLLQGNDTNVNSSECTPPIRKAIGQLLMFQPETGTISLNLAATKHLFQAIGGKLIVRQRPKHGEVMTIFLPLEVVDESKGMCLGHP
jgi:signal transduction histidine kinase